MAVQFTHTSSQETEMPNLNKSKRTHSHINVCAVPNLVVQYIFTRYAIMGIFTYNTHEMPMGLYTNNTHKRCVKGLLEALLLTRATVHRQKNEKRQTDEEKTEGRGAEDF